MFDQKMMYNVKCDVCGALADEMYWESKESAEYVARDSYFKKLGGKHYCPQCWEIDDNDDLATKDGRKFDYYTEEEIID